MDWCARADVHYKHSAQARGSFVSSNLGQALPLILLFALKGIILVFVVMLGIRKTKRRTAAFDASKRFVGVGTYTAICLLHWTF